jgi:hypothetical protein
MSRDDHIPSREGRIARAAADCGPTRRPDVRGDSEVRGDPACREEREFACRLVLMALERTVAGVAEFFDVGDAGDSRFHELSARVLDHLEDAKVPEAPAVLDIAIAQGSLMTPAIAAALIRHRVVGVYARPHDVTLTPDDGLAVVIGQPPRHEAEGPLQAQMTVPADEASD